MTLNELTPAQRRVFDRQFWAYFYRRDEHIRVPNQAGFFVHVIGQARDLHGPTGVCTCCPRRPPT